MKDYKLAINHTIESTGLNLLTYMKKYALPCPEDWPTEHFIKKLIAQQSNIHWSQNKALPMWALMLERI